MSKREPNIYRIITVCTCGKHNKYEFDLPKEPINALLIESVEAAMRDLDADKPNRAWLRLEAALKGVR